MMQMTQQEMEVGVQKRGIKEYAREKKEHAKAKLDPMHIKAKFDPVHVKAKLDPAHVKAKLDPVHVKAKLDEKKDFAKTKLEKLKQKIGAKTAGEQEQE